MLKGAKESIRDLKALSKDLQTDTREDMALDAANVIKAQAQATAPVRTGKFRRSITAEKFKRGSGPSQAFVTYDLSRNTRDGAPHALLVEFGTKHTAPRSTLRRAAAGTGSGQQRAMEARLDKAIDDFNRG